MLETKNPPNAYGRSSAECGVVDLVGGLEAWKLRFFPSRSAHKLKRFLCFRLYLQCADFGGFFSAGNGVPIRCGGHKSCHIAISLCIQANVGVHAFPFHFKGGWQLFLLYTFSSKNKSLKIL